MTGPCYKKGRVIKLAIDATKKFDVSGDAYCHSVPHGPAPMTSLRDRHLATAHGIRADLLELLEGMDYCLDWKPEPSVWCVREVVCHLLDTPPGGIHSIVRGILLGELEEYDIWAGRANMTPEKQAKDMAQLRDDINTLFQELEQALGSATDEDLAGKPVLAHFKSREVDEQRTVDMLLERGFDGHWREHLNQIGDLRASLGFS